jgi:TPR repeat protein
MEMAPPGRRALALGIVFSLACAFGAGQIGKLVFGPHDAAPRAVPAASAADLHENSWVTLHGHVDPDSARKYSKLLDEDLLAFRLREGGTSLVVVARAREMPELAALFETDGAPRHELAAEQTLTGVITAPGVGWNQSDDVKIAGQSFQVTGIIRGYCPDVHGCTGAPTVLLVGEHPRGWLMPALGALGLALAALALAIFVVRAIVPLPVRIAIVAAVIAMSAFVDAHDKHELDRAPAAPVEASDFVEPAPANCDGTDACVAACEKNSAPACRQVAEWQLLDRPNARTLALLDKACGAGDMRACSDQGAVLRQDGDGYAADQRRAVVLFRKACDGKDLKGCGWLGKALTEGEGVPKDPAAALPILDKACKAGHAVACAVDGNASEDLKKFDRAMHYYREACDHDYFLACANVAQLFETGRGVDVDLRKAEEFYKKACDHDVADGCAGVSGLHYKAS